MDALTKDYTKSPIFPTVWALAINEDLTAIILFFRKVKL
ncbi:hypothetical protein AsAng_0057080 [Aureispira anguillae]|uniref:Uncharacterized protein n=1 Tax=Aureispira anguillae TaxID=2864201 RepID=A0A915YL34_9BACT|nr:hypothetical protein AsAng_0057080 [Aureispira anguillae]